MSTATTTLAQDCEALGHLKREAAEADSIASDLKEQAQRAEMELFERMDSEGVSSMKVSGTNFVRAETVYGQVQDRAEFVAWAEENMSELLETKERKGRMNEIIRERLDSGQELPPGVGFYVKQYVSQRAG